MTLRFWSWLVFFLVLGAFRANTGAHPPENKQARRWLAGDHHIHSRYSVGYDRNVNPPKITIGGDAIYPIPMNALMARHHGLSWMVATDHGGPNHSKVNLEQAYPELLQSRRAVPDLIQFYGMEFDTPGADHSSLIIPHSHEEARQLHDLEHRFSKNEAHPADPSRDTEPKMLEALRYMREMPRRPVTIANHPSRSAKDLGVYGDDSPRELRDWNDTAPEVAIGMEGAPGHQASTLNADGSTRPKGNRGGYSKHPTMGGFDQMTARLGGFWDSMLGEGRHWWITSTSDSHRNWREGGNDFWPGEYSKTYVFAAKNHDDILDGLRRGRVFVTTGDLISELYLTASTTAFFGRREAGIGDTLSLAKAGDDVLLTIRVRQPAHPNHHGDKPVLNRVDLIVGNITGPVSDRTTDTNPTTRVAKRFSARDWRRLGDYITMNFVLKNVATNCYVRVRGTNTSELEPSPDPAGENPWNDLWFYSNPVFIRLP